VGGLALLALGALSLLLSALASKDVVAELDVPLEPGKVTLSQPFDLPGGPQAVAIEATAAVRPAWVGLDVALIEEQSGESETVGFELSHYSGRDSDGDWSEGSNHGRAVAGGVRAGRYLVRVEPVLEGSRAGIGPTAHVRVVRGVFLLTPLLAALVLLLAWPVITTVALSSFEQRRWAESDHPPGGKGQAASSDDGDDG
jgi:hypothetical protein